MVSGAVVDVGIVQTTSTCIENSAEDVDNARIKFRGGEYCYLKAV